MCKGRAISGVAAIFIIYIILMYCASDFLLLIKMSIIPNNIAVSAVLVEKGDCCCLSCCSLMPLSSAGKTTSISMMVGLQVRVCVCACLCVCVCVKDRQIRRQMER